MGKKEFRHFAKFLLLAQTASDAGKCYCQTLQNCETAVLKNYSLKDSYIRQAVEASNNIPNVKASTDSCSEVVYFDVKGYGQISFHVFTDFRGSLPLSGSWNGKRGGSLITCKKIAKRLNLPFYR